MKAPWRSEQAAFTLLLGTVAVFGVFIVVLLIARAIF